MPVENNTRDTNEERSPPAFNLISSDEDYPITEIFELAIPLHINTGRELKQLKEDILTNCRLAAIDNFKLVNASNGYRLMLRNEIDQLHYTFADAIYDDEPMGGAFKTDTGGQHDRKMQQKLRRRFRKAARRAGLQNNVLITNSEDKQSVMIFADTLKNYFRLWTAMPKERRKTLLNSDVPEFYSEDTLDQAEHSSPKIA